VGLLQIDGVIGLCKTSMQAIYRWIMCVKVEVLDRIRHHWANSEHVDLELACTLLSAKMREETTLRAVQSCLKILRHSLETAHDELEPLPSLSAAMSTAGPPDMTEGDKALVTEFLGRLADMPSSEPPMCRALWMGSLCSLKSGKKW
jgi:hypothetical protein